MKRLVIIFLWSLILTPLNVWSQDSSPTIGPISFCHMLADAKKQELTFKKRLDLFHELILMKFFPKYYSIPEIQTFESSNDVQLEKNGPKTGRNIIFAMGPDPVELANYRNDSRLQQEYDDLLHKISEKQKIIRKMFKARKLEKCSRIARENKFDQSEYVNLVNKLVSIP